MAQPEKLQHTVALQRCGSYDPQQVYLAIGRQLELLGGADCFFQKDQRVLIKPNLIVPKGPDIPAQTHPEVIYAMARIVKEVGALPVVGDSPAWGTTVGCLKALGIDQRLRELGAEIVNLNQPVRMEIAGANMVRTAVDRARTRPTRQVRKRAVFTVRLTPPISRRDQYLVTYWETAERIPRSRIP